MQQKRFAVFICNLIISVLCVLAVGAYFLFPLWKVDFSYTLTAEALESVMQSAQPESGGEETDVMEQINFQEVLGEEGVTFAFSFEIKTQDVLSSLNTDLSQKLDEVIAQTVDLFVDQLSEPLSRIAEQVIKQASKEVVKESVKESVKEIFQNNGSGKTDEELQEILNNTGITDEYIGTKTDELMDALYAENATTSSVAEKVTETVEEVFEKLNDSGYEEFADVRLSTEDKENLQAEVEEVLATVADENGNINMDDLVSQLLLQMLNSEEPQPSNERIAGNSAYAVKTVSTPYATEPEGEDATQQLKQELTASIMESIPPEAVAGLAQGVQFVAYFLLFTFCTWAYLILKILLKMFSDNNSIKLKLPILLGWLPFLVLFAIPTLLISLLQAPPAALVETMGAETFAQISQITSSLSLTFYSASWVSFAVAVVLALFVIIIYGGLRKQLVKAIREGEKSKKIKPVKKAKKEKVIEEEEFFEDEDYE